MNIKSQLIALAVSILADRTEIVRKTEPVEGFFYALMCVETPEQTLTRTIEETLNEVTGTVKRIKTDREFKKIIQNV